MSHSKVSTYFQVNACWVKFNEVIDQTDREYLNKRQSIVNSLSKEILDNAYWVYETTSRKWVDSSVPDQKKYIVAISVNNTDYIPTMSDFLFITKLADEDRTYLRLRGLHIYPPTHAGIKYKLLKEIRNLKRKYPTDYITRSISFERK